MGYFASAEKTYYVMYARKSPRHFWHFYGHSTDASYFEAMVKRMIRDCESTTNGWKEAEIAKVEFLGSAWKGEILADNCRNIPYSHTIIYQRSKSPCQTMN